MTDEPLIHARGLVKRFGDFIAVDGIDVDVRPGEAFGFLGPNGAGKSSTMRMVGCVSPPTGGHAAHPRARPASATARRSGPGSASCPQQDYARPRAHRHREPDRLRAVLRHPAREWPRARAAELLEFVQLTERADEQGRAAVGRHEAAADDRPRAGERARAAAARRADHRPRPAGPAPGVGAAVPAQAARRDAGAHHPLHGRGRAAVRPAGGDGPRARSWPRARRAS